MRFDLRGFARTALGALFMASALGFAAFGRADPLAITRWTVDGGGSGVVQLGSIVIAGTAGQPDAGLLSAGDFTIAGGFWIPGTPLPLGVDGGGPGPDPVTYQLLIRPTSPNPMVQRTRISFELPEEREVEVQVFDLGGALRRTVASGRFTAGTHGFDWDGRDADGHRVRPGVYVVRVRLGAFVRAQKLVVLR